MIKSELETGMIVALRNGDEYMVLREAVSYTTTNCMDIIVRIKKAGYCFLNSFNEDLTSRTGGSEFDIMQVYRAEFFGDIIANNEERILVWKRKEKKRYTYAQLREILGEEFEVVG